MTDRRRGFAGGVLGALATTLVLSLGQPATGAQGEGPDQTSEGVPGAIAIRARGVPVVTDEVTYEVAPGLTYRQWDQTDLRGPIRAYLLTVDLDAPGLHVGLATRRVIRERRRLTGLLAEDGAIAGVNGDFFDIDDTGAPLGLGVDEGRFRHGPKQGWNTTFRIDKDRTPHIGRTGVVGRIRHRPGIRITNVNSPQIPVDGIGVYTRAWGRTAGYRVVEGARRRAVREVVVRHGRVVSNRRQLSRAEPIDGPVLIGRGDGADDLRRLRVGNRVRLVVGARGNPRVVIGGNAVLVRGGEVVVTDDVELHPRTAIGIDRDAGTLLLLVVDGRQDLSRGYTMVELAQLLRSLGAESALNLDGGGSSTLVTRPPDGKVTVANSPSGGVQRRIPNGLGITVREP